MKQQWGFENGTFKIKGSRDGNEAAIVFSGSSDAPIPGAFVNLVTQQLAPELQDCNVVVDFTAIEFMNSSTIPALIALIKRLNGVCASCRVVYVETGWQRTHLRCMQAIARSLDRVKVEGRPGPGPASSQR